MKKELGAANTGFHDWYWQRISAAFLLLSLPGVFITLLGIYTGNIDYPTLHNWLVHPAGKTGFTLIWIAMLLHMWTGLKVIIEDYVHTTGGRVMVLNGLLACLLLIGLYEINHIWSETSYILNWGV